MPNMVYIIEKQGRSVYKAMWTVHLEFEGAQENPVLTEELAAIARHCGGRHRRNRGRALAPPKEIPPLLSGERQS